MIGNTVRSASKMLTSAAAGLPRLVFNESMDISTCSRNCSSQNFLSSSLLRRAKMRKWQIHCHHARLHSMGLFTIWSYLASGWRLKDTLFWDNLEGSGHIAFLVVHLLHIICLTYAIILEMNECSLTLSLCFNVTTSSCSFSRSRDHCDIGARIELYLNLLQHSYIHLHVPQILPEMANRD